MNRKHVSARLRHALGSGKPYTFVLLALVVFALLNVLTGGTLLAAERSLWNEVLDPIVGLSTLAIAVAVWWGESGQDWRGSLPKRLTVDFLYQGRLVMRCEEADLASEGDIRALGQQIGGQMAAKDQDSRPEQLLLKAPAIRYAAPRLSDDGTALLYQASFELIALPEKLQDLAPGQYWHWTPPFNQPGISTRHGQ